MIEKFKTLNFVKSSIVFLYLALTLPIPFVSSNELKIISVVMFLLGLYVMINITNDYVETCNKKISFKTTYLSKVLGKQSWEIFWKDIKSIKSFTTSQGSKVHYFVTKKNESFLVPQRIENFSKFISMISKETNLKVDGISYLSPLWTYKLLTFLSISMIIGEILTLFI